MSIRLAGLFFKLLTLLILFLLSIIVVFRPASTLAQTILAAGTIPPTITYTWTAWGAEQYALADDGDDLWIGASGSIVRWHKPSQTYRRYSGVDGLPHRHVFAVAVDNAGNHWFGGDGGLSRLDKDEVWSHFTPDNSGLQSMWVDGIAVGADNTLWVSHGLPDGRISRRNSDGSWTWFPSRAAVAVSDYNNVLLTQNRNSLWAVADGKIWLGFLVYDGTKWVDTMPGNETAIPLQVTAAAGNIWALIQTGADDIWLNKWANGAWSQVELSFYPNFYSYATSFAISKHGEVWIGYNLRGPYSRYTPNIISLEPNSISDYFDASVPIRAMLVNDEGLWTIGPAWLRTPDGVVHHLTDTLTLPKISDVMLDGEGKLWLNSYDVHHITYSDGKLQMFGDLGTASLEDDEWTNLPTYYHIATAWERTPSGDLLSLWGTWSRTGWWSAQSIRWDRASESLQIPLPYYYSASSDIFAMDDHHLGIAFNDKVNQIYAQPTDLHRIFTKDDHGTPTDFEDDIWRSYRITSTGKNDVVAVDVMGKLWFGNTENLYRFQDEEGQPVFENSSAICDLTVDDEGFVYALWAQYEPCETTDSIYVIDPENSASYSIARVLARDRYFTLRSARHRNKLWTVAPDGAIWYIAKYSLPLDYTRSQYQIERYDGTDVTAYPLPFTSQTALQLEVDSYNNVWFVHDNQLWRLSQPPGFVLNAQPLNWKVQPGNVYAGEIALHSRDNYSGSVSINAITPSNDISVSVTPNPLTVGQTARITVVVAEESQQHDFSVKLQASDTVLTETVILSITVAETENQSYLPLITR